MSAVTIAQTHTDFVSADVIAHFTGNGYATTLRELNKAADNGLLARHWHPDMYDHFRANSICNATSQPPVAVA